MAAVANLLIDQGATFTSDITVKDINGNIFDLTNYTVRAQLALGYSSTRTRQSFLVSVTNPTSGIISISLTAAQTAALDSTQRYVYDVETISATNAITRVIEGIITVRPSVTNYVSS